MFTRSRIGDFVFSWVYSGATRGDAFIRVCVGSLGHALASSASLRLEWVNSEPYSGRLVHSGSHGFTRERVVVVGLRLCSLGQA